MSLVVLFIASCFLYLLYNREVTRLRRIPGPFLASISQIWIVLQQRGRQRPLIDLALHRKYGSIVRIAPNEVLVSSPQSKKIIYGAASKFTKGDWYSATDDCGWSGSDHLDLLPELNMEKYRFQRRLIGAAYTASFMKELESGLDDILEKNLMIMSQRAGMTVNIDTFFAYFASDCVQMATFGKSLGFVEANADCGAIAFGHQLWLYMHWVGYLPIIHRTRLWYIHAILPKYKRLSSLFPQIRLDLNKPEPKAAPQKQKVSIYKFTADEVNQRIEKNVLPSHIHTIADKLFQIQAEKPALQDNWIKDMCISGFNAGVETIGITISTFLSFVISHPGCQEKIQIEVDEAKAAGMLSSVPRLKEIESLPYLNACLSESRRLHPPFAHPLARVVPKGGVELEGHWIPAGTTVGVNPWVLGRDKSLYGEDADQFRPERWLEFSPEQLKIAEASSMFFGNGARSCPGQYLAEAIFTKAIPLLMMNLKFRFTEPLRERSIESTFVTRLHNVMVQWETRGTA
ncbi:cytochrome P450 [Pyrenochaeta sp. MPI-SDFR-AT-0127]|nr:cytochrome P450 [Pyrenochaeta sp. MPI-SDFR-AT-0127]